MAKKLTRQQREVARLRADNKHLNLLIQQGTERETALIGARNEDRQEVRETRALLQAERKAGELPRQLRWVTRTIRFSGHPEWVARQLLKSLPDGLTMIQQNAIIVETTEDKTVDVLGRSAREILSSYQNQQGEPRG